MYFVFFVFYFYFIFHVFFFFNDTATTEIYTLSLHDALPILFVQADAVKSGLAPDAPVAVKYAGLFAGTAATVIVTVAVTSVLIPSESVIS